MNRRRLLNFILAGLTLPAFPNAFAASSEVRSVRASRTAGRFRLVLDLNGPSHYRTFTLDSPHRLVIDLPNTTLATNVSKLDVTGSAIKTIRGGAHGTTGSRIVLELKQPVKLDSLVLGPSGSFGDRLVFDLHPMGPATTQVAHAASTPRAKKSPGRDLVVVVDAGHGGKDPGCISAKGAYEKKVALAIAHNLAKRINKEKATRPSWYGPRIFSFHCASAWTSLTSMTPTCLSRSMPMQHPTAVPVGLLSLRFPAAVRRLLWLAGWRSGRTMPILSEPIACLCKTRIQTSPTLFWTCP